MRGLMSVMAVGLAGVLATGCGGQGSTPGSETSPQAAERFSPASGEGCVVRREGTARSRIWTKDEGGDCRSLRRVIATLPKRAGTYAVKVGTTAPAGVCIRYPAAMAYPLEVRCRHGDHYFELIAIPRSKVGR